jgi:hypothetical protein
VNLGELSVTAGVPAKWVLNGSALWGGPNAYNAALARQLSVTHELHLTLGMPVPLAFHVAARALAAHPVEAVLADRPVLVAVRDGAAACVAINLARVLAAVAARSAAWHAGYGERVAGRPRSPGRQRADEAIARAVDWGIDLSLVSANLQRSPAERLRQLEGMMAFRRRVRRVPDTST